MDHQPCKKTKTPVTTTQNQKEANCQYSLELWITLLPLTCALSSLGDPLSAAATLCATLRTCDRVSTYADDESTCG